MAAGIGGMGDRDRIVDEEDDYLFTAAVRNNHHLSMEI